MPEKAEHTLGGERLERVHLHEVAVKELLQPLLGCRIGQVTNVKAAALSRAGGSGIGGLVSDGGIGQSVSHVVDSSVSGLVLLSRHVGGFGCKTGG